MERVNETQSQSQPPSQRFYTLRQLGELAGTITLISEGLQAYRAQAAGLLAGQRKTEAFKLCHLLERQRIYLVEQIHTTRPLLMELENPLAPATQKLAEQLTTFPLMTTDYSKLTEVLERFAGALPDRQTTDTSVIGRLMNNTRLGHYPADLTHAGYITNNIVFPAENTTNLVDPCCGTGDVLLRLALGTDSQYYGVELGDHRAKQAQQQLYRVGFSSFFDSNTSLGALHAVFLNPPYLFVLPENGGRGRDERRFLIESVPLLMMGGLLTYIVLYYRLTADLCGIICDSFEQMRIHRFLDREFKQFEQVVATGVCHGRTEAEQDAEALCSAAEHPETLPTADLLPRACYELPTISRKVETFRGAVFNEDELARRLANPTGFDRLFAKSRLDNGIKRPLLPLSIGQVGLIGGSNLVNELVECDYPHIVRGRIIKEKHTVTDGDRKPYRRLVSTEIRKTVSNRVILNVLTPSGFRSLT